MACFAAKQYYSVQSSVCKKLIFIRNIHSCRNLKNSLKFYLPKCGVIASEVNKPCTSLPLSYVRPRKYSSEQKQAPELSFKDMILKRQNQAQCSVLIELISKEDVPYAAKLCKDYGAVKAFLTYSDGYSGTFLLTEFSHPKLAHQFLQGCYFRATYDSFPVYSRFVKFEKKKVSRKLPASLQNEIVDVSYSNTLKKRTDRPSTVSGLMKNLYEDERLSDLSIRLRFLFAISLQESVSGVFPFSEVIPFGSSVNGFGVNGSDLDIVMQLYPDNVTSRKDFYFQTKVYESRIVQQRMITVMNEIARNCMPGVHVNQRILHARVPILKLRHKILELDTDLSINNLTAVFMSEILYFCGSLDHRIRPLVYAVKRWAKESFITYASPGSWITNFQLTLLVLFFLQNRQSPILPPLMKAVALHGCSDNYTCTGIEYIESPAKWRNIANNNKEELGSLLKEFFLFLGSFSFKQQHISLLTGKATPKDDDYPLYIQYPMEEEMNVSKNVSKGELWQMCCAAKMSASFLEKCDHSAITEVSDLTYLMGCGSIKKCGTQEINVNSFINNNLQEKGVGVS